MIKKIIIFPLLFLLISSAILAEDETPGWLSYSNGLEYMNNKDYTKALQEFLKAAESGESLDLVYTQMAFCFINLNDYNQAITSVDKAISANPQNLQAYNIKYQIYYTLKNYEMAAQTVRDLIEIKPDMIAAYYTLGSLYYTNLKMPKEAIPQFQKILEISKRQSVEPYYREYSNFFLGYIYNGLNEKNKAIYYFENTASINPQNMQAQYVLSILYRENFQFIKAKNTGLNFLKSYPENYKINAVVGEVNFIQNSLVSSSYLRKGFSNQDIDGLISRLLYNSIINKGDDTEKNLLSITQSDPAIVAPHIALAKIYDRNQNNEEAYTQYLSAALLLLKSDIPETALIYLTRCQELFPDNPEIYYYLADAYEKNNNISMAIINFQRLYDLTRTTDVLIHLGYLYGSKGDNKNSVKYFDKALSLEPKNDRALFFKGLVFLQNNDNNEASSLFQKAIDVNDKDADYYYYLAITLEKKKLYTETVDALKKAISIKDNDSKFYNFLGYLYIDLNMNLDDGLILIEKAIELEPGNGAYLDSLGWAHYKRGNYSEAIRFLLQARSALDLEGYHDPVVYDHLADTYYKLGDLTNADFYWKEALKLDPKNSDIQSKLDKLKLNK